MKLHDCNRLSGNRAYCVILLILCLNLISCRAQNIDPFQKLEDQLRDNTTELDNGFVVPLMLDQRASANALISAILSRPLRNQGIARDIKLIESRTLKLDQFQKPCEAFLVDTNLGQQLVLAWFEGGEKGWNYRIFPVWNLSHK